MYCDAVMWVPCRGAQVRGNVPKVRIANGQIEERKYIETVNPQVRILDRQSTQEKNQKQKNSKNNNKSIMSARARRSGTRVFIG